MQGAAIVDGQGIAIAATCAVKREATNASAGERIPPDWLQVDVAPRIVKPQRASASRHLVGDVELGAIEPARIGPELIRRRLRDDDPFHGNRRAVLVQDRALRAAAA